MGILSFLVVGLAGRVFLLGYGYWQDITMAVKYTDVDYYVFTDAARFISQGKSPYLRPTYRYTPMLAWLLQPNILITEMFGKILFILFDILTGYLIHSILSRQGFSERTTVLSAAVWLLNPLTATISSRGNAESIMAFLVLLTLKLHMEGKTFLAAMFYSMSIHFKIYPVTYALPIYFALNDKLVKGNTPRPGIGGFIDMFWPTRKQLLFVVVTIVMTVSLTGIYYYWYGWEFLQHTYLYHISRKDIRHNFSIYFYLLYLTDGSQYSTVIALVLFIPQVVLLLTFSFKFYHDLPLCCFLQTFIFVAYNKVCTSQYFLWYLCLLPLLIPHMNMSLPKAVTTVLLWILGQAVWLFLAYLLEFEGFNTFIYIWLASCFFFIINNYIAVVIIGSYSCSNKSSIRSAYKLKNS